jgi:hypothetical protein
MITVNSISGGKTSSYMAVHYPADHDVFSVVCMDRREAAPKDLAVRKYAEQKLASFANQFGEFIATAEDDATLLLMMDLEQLMGKEITWVRGMSFDQIIDTKKFGHLLPTWIRRYCTTQMKMLPIFLWWWHNIGEKCEMRIGFRFDEFRRMQNFFNNSDPTNFRIPVASKTTGHKRQVHETFNWRYCSFPLVQDAITQDVVGDYWKTHGWIGGTLFEERRQIKFPAISNCIGCFHKKPETLAAMADIHPEKFKWFIDQEYKGMGTWLDSRITYQHIAENKESIGMEVLAEARLGYATCDSGGCTD